MKNQRVWLTAPADATHRGPATKTYRATWYKKERGFWHFRLADRPLRDTVWMKMQNNPTMFRFGVMEARP